MQARLVPIRSGVGQDRERLLLPLGFYLLCPIMIGLPMGWYQAGFGSQLTRAASVGLWISQWLVWWWTAELLLRGWRAALRPWGPGLLVVLLVAAASNVLLCRFTTPVFMDLFAAVSGRPDAALFPGLERSLLDPGHLWTLLKSSWVGSLDWIALRGCYEMLAGRPRDLGATGPVARSEERLPAPLPPPFLRRLRTPRRPDELLAIEAEDHYVRGHSARGSELIHHRFSDAVAELAGMDGVRVHRSFWVSRTAVVGADFQSASGVVRLSNGMTVPVGQRHRAPVERMLAPLS